MKRAESESAGSTLVLQTVLFSIRVAKWPQSFCYSQPWRSRPRKTYNFTLVSKQFLHFETETAIHAIGR